MNKIKAISLVSGGLDSTLATKIILEQDIDVMAINFLSPFCLCNRRGGCRYEAKHLSDSLGIKLEVVNVSEEFLEIVKHPRFGYGSNLNPCIDCRILMFKKTKEFMNKINASFVITGEVLGQRPMSQHRRALNLIEKESGLEGLVVRPLSARLLDETIPEKEGWISREKLLDYSGRTRKPQMALAKEFGINDYPCSAGGCLLTDPAFSLRMKDLLKYNNNSLNHNEIALLKLGRHFRLGEQTKLIVGRNQQENENLLQLVGDEDYIFEPKEVPGPIAVGRGRFDNQETLNLACRIVTRYSDSQEGKPVKINLRKKGLDSLESKEFSCIALDNKSLEELRI